VQDDDVLASRLAAIDALVLIRERTRIRGALLDGCPTSSLISTRSVYPHIDIAAARASASSSHRTCTLALPRSRPPSSPGRSCSPPCATSLRRSRRLRDGKWQAGVGSTLHGKTLGIYGYGRIGKVVAQYGRTFGMRVVVWGRNESRATAAAEGWEVAPSKPAFFEMCDVLTLHMRLVDATRGIVTNDDLARMKPTALFVNSSRAGLVEAGALVESLRAGRPGMAAVTTSSKSSRLPIVSNPLLTMMPNVVATPHIGYVTREEWDLQFNDVYDQINAYAAGAPIHVVNPDVLVRQSLSDTAPPPR
jgi:D-3-phosphoglycerate dehydrogenase